MTEHDLDDLVSATDIAGIYGVHPSAVTNWKNRHADFPQPIKNRLYSRREVERWYEQRVVVPGIKTADDYDHQATAHEHRAKALRKKARELRARLRTEN